jgi:hypothetical protein
MHLHVHIISLCYIRICIQREECCMCIQVGGVASQTADKCMGPDVPMDDTVELHTGGQVNQLHDLRVHQELEYQISLAADQRKVAS